MHHGNGGTGSAEHTAAVAFNGGVQRRNSITQAHEIHALQPTGAAAHVSRAQLEGVRHGGAIDANALMALVHPSTEVPWDPAMGQGRLQIRTGRNFSVPQTGGGTPFDIRIHTRDNKQAGIDATSNASVGSVVRVQEGKRAMLSEKVVSTDKTINKLDWIGASSKNPVLQNSAHIPAVLPPVATPPRSRA